MRILGIDPGQKGGLTIIQNGQCHQSIVMPIKYNVLSKTKKNILDAERITSFLQLHSPYDSIYVEKVGARPGQGVVSMFSFGYSSGVLEGIIFGLGLGQKLHFISPQKWMRYLFEGLPFDGEKQSISFCQIRFPSIDWRNETLKRMSKKKHDGKTDSACIAYYGYLIEKS